MQQRWALCNQLGRYWDSAGASSSLDAAQMEFRAIFVRGTIIQNVQGIDPLRSCGFTRYVSIKSISRRLVLTANAFARASPFSTVKPVVLSRGRPYFLEGVIVKTAVVCPCTTIWVGLV